VKVKILHLPVALTDDEQRAKGKQLAATALEYSDLEAERREVAAELGLRLKEKRKTLDRLAIEVRTGLESRPVECNLVPIWGSHTVVTLRSDTREQVDSRTMTHAERQLELSALDQDGTDAELDDDDDDSAPH